MFVAVEGEGPDGQKIERSWHLLAEGEDGPFIPSMAGAAIIRHCLHGEMPAAGARAATGELEVADYDALFAQRRITTGRRQSLAAGEHAPLYRRLLGEAWDRLPEPLRVLHDLDADLTAGGYASVERGKSPLARLAAWIIGFPPAGEDVPVSVSFRVQGGKEHWHRTFAGRRFASTQEAGRGRFDGLLLERFGPLAAGMALVLEDGRMRLVVRRWSVFGIPMPLALAPRGDSYEFAADGRFNFHVEIRHPLAGLIVAYRGWLVPRQ
jgi:hypothetical protein